MQFAAYTVICNKLGKQRDRTPAFSNRRANQMQPRVTIMTGRLRKSLKKLIEKFLSETKNDNFVFSNAQDRSISMNSTSRQMGWQDRKQI